MGLFNWGKKDNKKTAEAAKPLIDTSGFISAEEYFFNYLAYEMQQISSDNLNPQTVYYETFEAFATPMLEMDGRAGAFNERAQRFMFGLDGEKNIDKAIELFEKAIEFGHPDAMANLAEIYRNPNFDRVDYKKYFIVIEKAAKRGSWMGMFNLSRAYYKGKEAFGGIGVERDKAKAVAWEVAAANMACDILTVFSENRCSKRFMSYMQRVHQVCVQGTHGAVQEMLSGDGIPVDKQGAKKLLEKVIPLDRKSVV